MEILLVLIVVAAIAAAAFFWMRSRGAIPGRPARGQGPALRGSRGTRRAARHDPMADAVERHAMATDPHEAAEAELRMQAQANRVASDLHAQQASELESDASRAAASPGAAAPPADSRPPPEQEGGPAYYDEQGRPVYPDDRPRY